MPIAARLAVAGGERTASCTANSKCRRGGFRVSNGEVSAPNVARRLSFIQNWSRRQRPTARLAKTRTPPRPRLRADTNDDRVFRFQRARLQKSIQQ